MKRIMSVLAAIVIMLGAACGPTIEARPGPPVHPSSDIRTATGAWSWSTCRAGIAWWGVPGSGAFYFNQATPTLYYWLDGIWHQEYARMGYECGPLGGPRGGSTVYNLAVQPIGGAHVHAVAPRVVSARHIHFDAGCIAQMYSVTTGATSGQARIPCLDGAGNPIP